MGSGFLGRDWGRRSRLSVAACHESHSREGHLDKHLERPRVLWAFESEFDC